LEFKGFPTNVLDQSPQQGLANLLQNDAMKKLFFISLSAAWLWVGSTATFAQVDRSDPEALIKTATQQILNEARRAAIKQGDTQSVIGLVDKDVLPYFDFQRTTQLATGRYWRNASANQQDQLVDQFETLLIRTYSGAFTQIKADQQIDFKPFRATPGDNAVVVRTVVTNNGQAIQIDYRLEKTEYGWRLYDWSVQGTWLTATYQRQFAETLSQSVVDGLIRFLSQRNQKLASGTPTR
jgi:phospholipid transport system substrate-binding protein